MMRRRVRFALYLLAGFMLPACAMIPPFQTAQVLLPGQSTLTADVQVESQPKLAGQEPSSGYPVFDIGYRSSMPWRGTDWGMTLMDDGFGLHGDIKQALWLPRNPDTIRAAIDAEILASAFGGWDDGLSLIVTQPLGPVSLTLGARYGFMALNIWGEDDGFPGLFGTVTSNYVDVFGGLDIAMGEKGDLVLGLDWRDMLDPYLGGGIGYWSQTPAGNWIGVDIGFRSNLFLPFLGDHWGVPKKWIPCDSPDQESPEDHLNMARQLRVYGLYQDAVDELNAAQSMDPDPGPLDLELGHDLYMLGDDELAYFHYERAAKAFPKDPKIQEMLKMLEPKLRYR